MQSTTSRVQDRYVSTSERRYHYRDWGDAGNPPLLILHGVTGHSWEFDNVAERLSGNFHIFALDQRGHGASEWAPEYATDRMAEDVADVIGVLGLDRVSIVGHSMGGVVGYLLAARYPALIERLVVMDVGPETVVSEWGATAIPAMLDWYANAAYDTPDDAVAAFLGDTAGPTADEQRRFALNNLRQLDDGRWSWRFDAAGLHNSFVRDMPSPARQWAALRSIACPTLVVHAELSDALITPTAERMLQELQHGQLVQVPDAGHNVHVEQFEPLMEGVQSFLRS